jgi:hypothetical protein
MSRVGWRDRHSPDNIVTMGIKVIVIAALMSGRLAGAQNTGGVFSHLAVPIWGAQNGSFMVQSPDGTKAVRVDASSSGASDEQHRVRVRANGMEYKTRIGYWVSSELGWAPDSKAFFVTYSDGGAVGTYHVKVFYIDKSGLHETEPIPNGRSLFVPNCFYPEPPNVAAIKWMGGSSRLLIALEVPPHSNCASMGTFRAFEISVPDGIVLNRYGQLQAKRLFASSLGEELTNADDSCVRSPKACVPNWPRTGSASKDR